MQADIEFKAGLTLNIHLEDSGNIAYLGFDHAECNCMQLHHQLRQTPVCRKVASSILHKQPENVGLNPGLSPYISHNFGIWCQ